MRKLHALLLSSLLLVSACTPVYDNTDEVVRETKDESNNQSAIIPNYSLSDDTYRMILTEDSAKVSAAPGVTTNQMDNRLDIAAFEKGLRRHSKEYYNPDDYYFQPGQTLTDADLLSWLSRYEAPNKEKEDPGNPNGLNPELNEDGASEKDFRNNPRYISNIIEQDYLVRKKDNVVEVAGVTIGISMRTVYNFTVDGREYSENLSTDQLVAKGKEYANTILERLRDKKELQGVPIVFAIFEEERNNAKSPGNFLSKTYVEASENKVSDWKGINEDYVLFPSEEAEEEHFDDSKLFSDFRVQVSDYFPDFVGMIANGFYIDEELKRVKIDIPIQFRSQSEVVGFTQYVYSLVMEMFEDHYAIQVRINSMDQQESLIVKEPGEKEPFVYIYD
ncbi:CamS family sex pheromone protein [Halobacillus shinanisalinarum]|uniref:CamS family sex pheromone protein n=1 Tax=Halobacillus shinanisalinarum TaxID=2932258 RepID=A0ABY4GVM6_9BACI|nr:CamS family sex pheromone protein [Halobacillus shinanisalinarum]UOQ92024.1 CamS family sex pheromone protein [Halobacillus shinanisalinarum]